MKRERRAQQKAPQITNVYFLGPRIHKILYTREEVHSPNLSSPHRVVEESRLPKVLRSMYIYIPGTSRCSFFCGWLKLSFIWSFLSRVVVWKKKRSFGNGLVCPPLLCCLLFLLKCTALVGVDAVDAGAPSRQQGVVFATNKVLRCS